MRKILYCVVLTLAVLSCTVTMASETTCVEDEFDEFVDLDLDATTDQRSDDSLPEVGSSTSLPEVGSSTDSDDATSVIPDSQSTNSTLSMDTQQLDVPGHLGPLVDIFGPTLLSLEVTSSKTAKLKELRTNDALSGKNVIGVYFSADWCGPCRQFTPELVQFYDKMNSRKGRTDQFEIVWISRCRDLESFGQYFVQMPWIALPPQEAMGARGQKLSKLYNAKSIPTLVLLDDLGSVITKDARNMIPKDKAGIGFPWRNPLATLYLSLVPRSLRYMVRRHLAALEQNTLGRLQGMLKKRA